MERLRLVNDQLVKEAEVAAMRDVADFIGKAREIYGYEVVLAKA